MVFKLAFQNPNRSLEIVFECCNANVKKSCQKTEENSAHCKGSARNFHLQFHFSFFQGFFKLKFLFHSVNNHILKISSKIKKNNKWI